jgi:hypothetical protein
LFVGNGRYTRQLQIYSRPLLKRLHDGRFNYETAVGEYGNETETAT